MLVWWAVFFVSGFVSSYKTVMPSLYVLLFMLRGRGSGGYGRRFALFVLCASTALVLWTTPQQPGKHDGAGTLTGGAPAFATAAKERLLASLEDPRLGERSVDLLAALLFGSRERLDPDMREAYAYLGIAHFLALSGLHLGILMAPLAWAVSLLPIGRAARSACVLVVVATYCLVSGMPPSLVRAVALAAVFMIWRSTGRKTTLARSLLIAVLVLALIDERILHSGGFQLSCSAVLAIAVLGLPLLRLCRERIRGRLAKRVVTVFLSPVAITVSVNMLTLPLQLSFFGRAPILAPVYNLIAVLPVTLLLYLGLAHAALPFGFMRSMLAPPIDLLSGLLCDTPLRLAGRRQPAILSGGVCWPLYAAGLLLLVSALHRGRGRRVVRGVCALALLVSSFAIGGDIRIRSGSKDAGAAGEPRRLSAHTILFSDRILVIEEEIGRREAERSVRAIWKSGIGGVDRIVICPGRLRGWRGIGHIVSRIEFDEAVCSPYLPRCDGGIIAILKRRGVATRFVEGPDSIETGGRKFRLVAPPYPPPAGGSLPVDRARIRIVPEPARRPEGI